MRAWRTASRCNLTLKPVSKRAFTLSRRAQQDQSVVNILQHGKDGQSLSVAGWVKTPIWGAMQPSHLFRLFILTVLHGEVDAAEDILQ